MNMIYRKIRFSPQNKTSASLKLLTTTSALALVGCGGGGAGGGSFFVPGSGFSVGSTVASRLSLASRIVDGYVADAQVFPDFDFDGVMDADEAVFAVRSDSEGNVLLNLPSDRSYQLVSRGGTDINRKRDFHSYCRTGLSCCFPFYIHGCIFGKQWCFGH